MKTSSLHGIPFPLMIACSACGGSSEEDSTDSGNSDIDESIIMAASSAASPATAISVHSDPLYFTPFPFSTVLQQLYTPSSLTATTGFTNRKRFMIRSSSGNSLTIGTSGAVSANSTLVTYNDTLGKTFEAVVDGTNTTWFRLDSELHGVYSLDSDSSGNLSFSNNWGNPASPSSRGYVVFAVESGKIKAKARYLYNLSTYTHSSTSDSSFASLVGYELESMSRFLLTSIPTRPLTSPTTGSRYQAPSVTRPPTWKAFPARCERTSCRPTPVKWQALDSTRAPRLQPAPCLTRSRRLSRPKAHPSDIPKRSTWLSERDC